MFKYIFKRKWYNLIVIVLIAFNSFLTVYAATKMTILANALIEGNKELYIKIIGLILLLWIVGFIVNYIKSIIQETTIQKMSNDIRKEIIDNIWFENKKNINQKKLSEIKSFLNTDILLIEERVFKNLYIFVRFLGNALFSLIVLFLYNKYLFLLSTILIIVMNLTPKILNNRINKCSKLLSESNEKYIKLIDDIISGFWVLRDYKAKTLLNDLKKDANYTINKSKINYAQNMAIIEIIVGIINIASQLSIILLTGVLIIGAKISKGSILTIVELTPKVFDSFSILTRLTTIIKTNANLLEKIDKIKTVNSEETNGINVDKFESLKLENISYKYNENYIIRNFSCEFKKGEIYQIIGSSGSGKSTLLNLICGYIPLQNGKILYNNKEINYFDNVTYVRQTEHIFDVDIEKNITLGREIDNKRLKDILNLIEIKNSNINSLSGGEKQKISFSRILLESKDIIILDESFSNVDETSEKKLMEELLKMDKTIIMVSHRKINLENFEIKKINIKGEEENKEN